MGRVRVVVPGTERIEISDGDWIEIKKTLNTGDVKRLEGAGLKPPIMLDGRIITPVDWGLYEIERAAIWLTSWSLVGMDGKDTMPINVKSLQSLDISTFEEIDRAILAYVKQQDEEKKSKTPAAPKPTGDGSESGQKSE